MQSKTKIKGRCKTLAIFHCSVGNAKSAASADAYIEGKKGKDKLTGNIYDYTSRKDVICSETALAENAPEEWRKDSAKLWEAAALAEQPGGRQAKKEEIALPSNWTHEQCIEVCRRRAEEITKQGHCVTWAIHDKGDGNIHAHFMRTVRAIDKNGKFKKYKSKKEYLYEMNPDGKTFKLDADGNKIKIPQWEKVQLLDEEGKPVFNKGGKPVYAKDDKGEWIYKLDANGNKIQKLDERNRKQWQSRMIEDLPTSGKAFVSKVRQEWETLINEYLPENEKISCKSLAEQGIDRLPTVHEGQGERAEERREQNKLIKEYNQLLADEKAVTAELEELKKEPEEIRAEAQIRVPSADTSAQEEEKGEEINDAGRTSEDDELAKFRKQLEDISRRVESQLGGGGRGITDEELNDFRIEANLDSLERQESTPRPSRRSAEQLQQAFRELQLADKRMEEQERAALKKARQPEHEDFCPGR